MDQPPSNKQLDFLERLKYSGEMPQSTDEATAAITAMLAKEGQASAQAALMRVRSQQQKAKEREAKQAARRQLMSVKQDLKFMQSENRFSDEPEYLGYIFQPLDDEPTSPEDQLYRGAFISLEVATKYPHLLVRETLDPMEVLGSERLPHRTPVVLKPGKVRRPAGCLSTLLTMVVLVVLGLGLLIGAAIMAIIYEWV